MTIKCSNLNGVVVSFEGRKLTRITIIPSVNGKRTKREHRKALKTLLSRKWGARKAASYIKTSRWQGELPC